MHENSIRFKVDAQIYFMPLLGLPVYGTVSEKKARSNMLKRTKVPSGVKSNLVLMILYFDNAKAHN
jgi:hypothetical protein